MWLMRFNVLNCYMQFTQAKIHRINTVYYLHDTALVFSDHCKYLGITLQSNLRWDKHIHEKIANLSCTLGLDTKEYQNSSTNIRDLAYKALVRPKLEYASVVWSPCMAELSH